MLALGGGTAALVVAYVAWLSAAPRTRTSPTLPKETAAEAAAAPAWRPSAPAVRASRADVALAQGEGPRASATFGPREDTVLAAARAQAKVDVFVNASDVDFRLNDVAAAGQKYEKLNVTVSGPNGFRRQLHYAADAEGTFSIAADDGSTLPDGLYKYETYAETELVGPPRGADLAAAPDGDGRVRGDARVIERQQRPAQAIQSGSFRIAGGQIVQPETEREQAGR